MNSNDITKGILKSIGYIIGVLIVLLFLYKIQSVILYVIIAAIISLIGLPIVNFLKNKFKFNNTVAVIVTIIVLIGLLSGLVGLFIPLVVEQGHNLSLLNMNELQTTFESLNQKVISYLSNKNIEVSESLTKSNLFSKIDYSLIPEFLNSVVSGFGSLALHYSLSYLYLFSY